MALPVYTIRTCELNSDGVSRQTNDKYVIHKYEKPIETAELYKYRSVITMNNKIVCFSPPKSLSHALFSELYSAKEIVAEEYIEGTMVNVFWNGEEWEFASKSKIISGFFFDTNDNFPTIVYDTFLSCRLDVNNLNKLYCYSFVMQHQNNRIVTKFECNRLYLIEVYRIDTTDPENTLVYVVDKIRETPELNNTTVQFPEKLSVDLHATIHNMPYTFMGVSFKETSSGHRCKLRNPAYEYVRQLRGNQPKLQYRYFELRKTGKVAEYLRYYPEHTEYFNKYKENLHKYTHTLYLFYVEVYIKKTKNMDNTEQIYKKSLYNLHQLYKTTLAPQKLFINLNRTIEYINSLPEAVLMTLCRHT